MRTRLLAGCISVAIAVSCLTYEAQVFSTVSVFETYAASIDDLTFLVYSDSASVSKCNVNAEGIINIPSEYEGVPVTTIAKEAFKHCEKVTAVVLPDTIKQIGYDAFSYCSFESFTIKNPKLEFYSSAFNGTSLQLMYGYAGSSAEYYARNEGIAFVAIDEAQETIITSTPSISTSTLGATSTTSTTQATTTTKRLTTTTWVTTTVNRNMPLSMMKYDVNGNGSVNIADAVLLVRYISEEDSVQIPANGNPDVNNDGVLTVEDVRAVLKALKPFSVKIGKTTAKPGGTIKIPVQIYGDKGTAAGQVYINYDSRLTPVAISAGDAYSMSFESEAGSYPLFFAWTSQNGQDQTATDGAVIAYLEFKVDSNIPKTEYLEVSIVNQAGWNYTRFSDSNGYLYSASYGSGYITVIP